MSLDKEISWGITYQSTQAEMVVIHATYQCRGYVRKGGHRRLDRALADCATLYNAALQERRDAWKMQSVSVSLYDQMKSLTLVRSDDPAWRAYDVKVGRGVLRRVDRAYRSFFRRVRAGQKPGFPRFRSRRRYTCIEVTDPTAAMVKISPTGEKAYVRVKGLPVVQLRLKRPLPPVEGLRALRIIQRSGGVTVDLVYREEREPLPPSDQAVGIDVGVNNRLALSNGEMVSRRDLDTSRQTRLQQTVSLAVRGSHNRRKKVKALQRERRRLVVRNRNECHRITTSLVRQYGRIAVEKLAIPNMTASASGTVEEPGTMVAKKSGLNREVLAQTWGLIRQQLRYKAEWAGRELVEVDPRYTSLTCSGCGVRSTGPLDEYRVFRCLSCSMTLDRDTNAARNILTRAFGPTGVGLTPGVESVGLTQNYS